MPRAQVGAGADLPMTGRVFISIKDADNSEYPRAAVSVAAESAMKARTEGEIGVRTLQG